LTLLLDHRGNPIVSPEREARLRYDAAVPNESERDTWSLTDSLSADAAHDPETRRRLRERARYEAGSDPVCAGIVGTLVNDVIGTGPRLQVRDEASAEIEAAWKSWCRVVGLPRLLRTLRRSKCVDGEVFAVKTSNLGLRHPVKLDVMLFETEQVADPRPSYTSSSDGIVFDDWGRPAAYKILRQHPGSTTAFGMPTDATLVPAHAVCHLFTPTRPGQTRGVPEITASLNLFHRLRRYREACVEAAENAANMSVWLKTQTAPDKLANLSAMSHLPLHPGAAVVAPAGYDPVGFKPEHPTQTYEAFTRTTTAEAGRPLGMSRGTVDGDFSGFNYSSAKLSRQGYERGIDVDRNEIEEIVLRSIFSSWFAEAVAVGIVPNIPEPETAYHWPGFPLADASKESSAATIRLDGNMTTLAAICARDGHDWQEVLTQRAAERRLMRELGLLSAAPAPPAPNDDEEDEEETEADE
jgi:lambda family phage portal protein